MVSRDEVLNASLASVCTAADALATDGNRSSPAGRESAEWYDYDYDYDYAYDGDGGGGYEATLDDDAMLDVVERLDVEYVDELALADDDQEFDVPDVVALGLGDTAAAGQRRRRPHDARYGASHTHVTYHITSHRVNGTRPFGFCDGEHTRTYTHTHI